MFIFIHDLMLKLPSSALYVCPVCDLHPGPSSDPLMPHWLWRSTAVFKHCSKVHGCMKQGWGITGKPDFLKTETIYYWRALEVILEMIKSVSLLLGLYALSCLSIPSRKQWLGMQSGGCLS